MVAAAALGCGGSGATVNPPVPQDVAAVQDAPNDAATLADVAADAVAMMDVAVMDVAGDAARADVSPSVDTQPADVRPPTDTATPTDVSAMGDVAMADVVADASAGPYPPGPYGNRMGDVLANLSWEGYVNSAGGAISTTRPYGTTTLQQLRGSGRGYALVHVSDFY